MLSTERRFLFVHIPKTGGNSIQDVLRPLSDDQVVSIAPYQDGIERFELRSGRYRTHKHSTLEDYRREYGADLFGSLLRFTCVRNPWDRVVSHYFSPHRGPVQWERQGFMQFIPEVRPVADYLRLADDAESGLDAVLRNVHRVLRFERLQADFDALCDMLGLPRQVLPQRNRSVREDYSRYFDDESRDLVGHCFREEIEAFEYTFGTD